MTDVLFPQISQKDPEAQGTLATWFADDGSAVTEGDLLAEVAVDKVDMEVLAPCSGTLTHAAEEGAVLVQGAVIGSVS
ncbi:biotin/lipoyl-containing protein [Flexivirga oryzae]|uniref:Pyruvate/2-oxoglutarate dehydrogenase complex dihydrolipoamide acyltransferase (E2) component n=1 Tax=Flexivirga oryzae TaxID=1794944 RepID=A0A839N0X4_9MICO|nr:lipoyl domain-containing protein [Flexivirga oryzae]MBB2890469.1 pyruvate/2-oxoglutarate dehydrogenase complex dihydrolipoamide acyltransferase (E2) component [Flexivirga oryzae]